MTFVTIINRKIKLFPPNLVYIVGLFPATYYLYMAFNDSLGPDPLKALEHELGHFSLKLMVVVLAITPLKDLLKINLVKFRRAFGLLAFVYATLHVLTYFILDQQLIISLILNDFSKKPFIIFGAIAFMFLIPLAITSNDYSIKLLKPVYWKRLHSLVYFSVIAIVFHYILSVKAWPLEPIIYAILLLILIIYRGVTKYVLRN